MIDLKKVAEKTIERLYEQQKKENCEISKAIAPDWSTYQREFNGAEVITFGILNSRGEYRMGTNISPDERVCVIDSGTEAEVERRRFLRSLKDARYRIEPAVFLLNKPLQLQIYKTKK